MFFLCVLVIAYKRCTHFLYKMYNVKTKRFFKFLENEKNVGGPNCQRQVAFQHVYQVHKLKKLGALALHLSMASGSARGRSQCKLKAHASKLEKKNSEGQRRTRITLLKLNTISTATKLC